MNWLRQDDVSDTASVWATASNFGEAVNSSSASFARAVGLEALKKQLLALLSLTKDVEHEDDEYQVRVTPPPSPLPATGPIFFNVAVSYGGSEWLIARRYNEFNLLKEMLLSHNVTIEAPFPPKHPQPKRDQELLSALADSNQAACCGSSLW